MKVHVITRESYTGEYTYRNVDRLFKSLVRAEKYVRDKNAERQSDYSPLYELEPDPIEVDEGES